MQSRYADHDAARLLAAAPVLPEALVLRTYTARLLGSDAALVLHGGGNTSAKGSVTTLFGEKVDVMWVKGSGWDLATIEPAGHPAVRLAPLRALRSLPGMTDEDMVNALRLALLDASAPTPSVETLLHAFLPAAFVDHTHADAVLKVANQPNGEAMCREIFGAGLVWVPYVMPGFALAKRCAEAFDAVAVKTTPSIIVLEHHGIFSFGQSAKESYERMIAAVTACERFIESRRANVVLPKAVRDPKREERCLPRLRGALAHAAGLPPERGPVMSVRSTPSVLGFLELPQAKELSQKGCATPDHVLRTKATPLFMRGNDEENVEARVRDYAVLYDANFETFSREKPTQVPRKKLDPWPRVVLVPKVGIVAVGRTRVEADMAADIYEHTIDVILDATFIGSYSPVSAGDLFDVEYWSLEQAKLKKVAEPPLGGAVALVTGAASGIGEATAARLAELGAHVVRMDRVAPSPSKNRAVFDFQGNVTREADVAAAVGACVREFGGLDLVVSNAGTAPQGALHDEAGDALLRQSLEENLHSHRLVAEHATRVMLAQGRGGCLLFNASKAAFNPGPDFGPYAVAKSALVALMKQFAVDLGKHGIRANAVNADRVRTGLFGGGVLEARAAARGIAVDDYFRANLLQREVLAADVADAFAYLAGARATTGCVITVDGGNSAAFPR